MRVGAFYDAQGLSPLPRQMPECSTTAAAVHQWRLSVACIPVPEWLRIKDIGLDSCGEERHKVVQEEVVDVRGIPLRPSVQDGRLVNPLYAVISNLAPVGRSHHCDLHPTYKFLSGEGHPDMHVPQATTARPMRVTAYTRRSALLACVHKEGLLPSSKLLCSALLPLCHLLLRGARLAGDLWLLPILLYKYGFETGGRHRAAATAVVKEDEPVLHDLHVPKLDKGLRARSFETRDPARFA